MNKKRIAVLDIQPMTPAVGGGRIRLLGLYSGMDGDCEVVYVGSYDWRGPKYRELKTAKNLTEIEVPLSEAHFAAHDQLSARVGKSCIDSSFPMLGQLSPEFLQRAREEAQKADIVIFSHPWLFPFVAPVIDEERQLVVYDSQNCEGLLKEKLLNNGNPDAVKVARAVVQSEWELCKAADVVLPCSAADSEAYVRLYGMPPDRMELVPNGVFTDKIRPMEDSDRQKLRERMEMQGACLCFIGSAYDPNVEAAQLVIQMADKMPDCHFFILGGVGSALQGLDPAAHPNVTVTGFLEEDEKLDYLHACDIALNPMLSGSGTNIKMFDFMAAGLPVITTETGARGIDNTNGAVYLLADSSVNALVKAARSLLLDEAARKRLSEGGRQEAEVRYSWEKLSLHLGKMLCRLHEEKISATQKVLMISSYPPENCGIGAYARQQVAWLRRNGCRVDVMAISGNGDVPGKLNSVEGILSLKQMKSRYDKIIIQYHASFFYANADRMERIRRHKAFEQVFLDNPNIEVVCHEVAFPIDEENGGLPAKEENRYKVRKWRAAPHVIFHTQVERRQFCEHIGIDESSPQTEIVAPNKYYTKAVDMSKDAARKVLGLPSSEKIFLCIGFIQPSKGFDKVAESFASIPDAGDKNLYIVGSLRVATDELQAYLCDLQRMDRENECIHLLSSYVSDECFDTWLIAADYVILPYREIWSSGVMGRAKLFEKPCIVRDVGGLREQLGQEDRLFSSYDELSGIIEAI